MRLQLSQADRNKQNILERQRHQERIKREEEALKRGAMKKEREIRKRMREEQLRHYERHDVDDHIIDEDEEEEERGWSRHRHSYLGECTTSCIGQCTIGAHIVLVRHSGYHNSGVPIKIDIMLGLYVVDPFIIRLS